MGQLRGDREQFPTDLFGVGAFSTGTSTTPEVLGDGGDVAVIEVDRLV